MGTESHGVHGQSTKFLKLFSGLKFADGPPPLRGVCSYCNKFDHKSPTTEPNHAGRATQHTEHHTRNTKTLYKSEDIKLDYQPAIYTIKF